MPGRDLDSSTAAFLVRVVGPERQGTRKWDTLAVSVLGARLGEEEEGQVEVL